MTDPVAAEPAGQDPQPRTSADAPATEPRRPGLIERRIVEPLLEVARGVDPRLPGLAHLSLALVHQMLVTSIKRAFRWIALSALLLVLGLMAVLGSSGWVRVAMVVLVVLPAAAVTGFAMGLRASMLRAIDATTGAYARPEYHDAITKALGRSRLPTGPFSLARMVLRTTVRGPRREVLRIQAVARELGQDLGLSDPDAEGAAPPGDVDR